MIDKRIIGRELWNQIAAMKRPYNELNYEYKMIYPVAVNYINSTVDKQNLKDQVSYVIDMELGKDKENKT